MSGFSDNIFIPRMDANKKKICKYGSKCYRKSQAHRRDYFHSDEVVKQDIQRRRKLKRKTEEKPAVVKIGGWTVENLSPESEKRKKPSKNSTNKGKKSKKDEGAEEEINEKSKTSSSSSEENGDSENDSESNSWTYCKSPTDEAIEALFTEDDDDEVAKSMIKTYYLLDMPPDFYSFFRFCQSLNEADPLNVFKSFDLFLVGPFEILAGKNIKLEDESLMLCHWRYYYDPPEFQTVIASQSGFHMGYWRDHPQEEAPFIASNTSEDCSFKTEGGNIFSAVYNYLTEIIKASRPFVETEAMRFQVLVRRWAQENNFSVEKFTDNIIIRRTKINTKTFHGLGIVVPVQKKTQVGYRPLNVSDVNLKKICQLIMKTEDEDEEVSLMDKLQPLIHSANIANDECDFGNSLELGIDLFCMGSSAFDGVVEHLLTNAYNLLKRNEFSKIITVHLKNRRRGKEMSIL